MKTIKWLGRIFVQTLVGGLMMGGLVFAVNQADTTFDVGIVKFFSSGNLKWSLGTRAQQNDSLFLHSIATEGDIVEVSTQNYMNFGASGAAAQPTGGLALPRMTSAQSRTNAIPFVGYIAYNTTNNVVCVATGTTASQWVKLATGSLVGFNTGCDQ